MAGTGRATSRDREAAKPTERHIVYIQVDGPFEYFDVAPETVEASADELTATGAAVESTEKTVVSTHAFAQRSVQGLLAGPMAAAPEPVRANLNQVMQAALFGGGSVRLFGSAVRTFNSGVTTLNQEYASAAATDFGVPAAAPAERSAETMTASSRHSEVVTAARVEVMGQLLPRYQKLLDTLDTDAGRSAAMLDRGPNEADVLALWGSGNLSLAAQQAFPAYNLAGTSLTQLPPDLRGKSDEEVAKYALDHPELAASLLPALNQHTKQLIGDELGRRGKTLGDTFDERKDGIRDEIDAFNKVLAAYGGDAVVATSFLNTIGPRGLLELNGRIATSTADAMDGYPGEQSSQSEASSIAALQKTLAMTLAAGTSGQPTAPDWNGDGAANYVSSQWTQQLITECEQKIGIMGNGTDQKVMEVHGYQLLSPLLGNGDHSPAFLNYVGGHLIDFEQEFAAEHNNHLPWERTKPLMADGLRLDWTHGFKDKDPSGWDPVTGLMRGLAADPEASRDFFTGVATGAHPPRYPRLDYLLTDRNWMVDRSWTGHGPEVNGITTLGDALKTATLQDPNAESVSIVQAMVREVSIDEQAAGFKNGDFGRTGDQAAKFSDATLINPALRGALGEIAANYIGSFHLSMAPNDPTGAVTDGYLYDDAQLSDIDARRFLADLGKDPSTAGSLTAASRTYAVLDLQRQLAIADPSSYENVLDRVTEASASVTGAIDFGATAAIQHNSEYSDKQFNDGLEKGFKIGKSMIGMIPAAKPPLVGGGIDVVLTDLQNSLKHNHIGQANYDTGNTLNASATQQQDFYRQVIWQNIPADQLPPGFKPGIDPKAQMADNPALEREYEKWTLGDNPRAQMLGELNVPKIYMAKYNEVRAALQNW